MSERVKALRNSTMLAEVVGLEESESVVQPDSVNEVVVQPEGIVVPIRYFMLVLAAAFATG